MKEFVIGLDIGTSSIKAVAMSISGKHEASAEIPLEIIVLFVFLPICVILVPVSACCMLLTNATE